MSDYKPEHRAEPEEPLVGGAPPRANTLFSNRVYDQLKFVAVILLPALGALYFGLAGIWGLPSAEEVVGTIVVIDTFLGVVLQISTNQYTNSGARFDGSITIQPSEEEGHDELGISLDPKALAKKDEVVVKVHRK